MKSLFFEIESEHYDIDFILQKSNLDDDFDPTKLYRVYTLLFYYSIQIA